MSESAKDVPYLTGSLHTFTQGYGYGARAPTVRNKMTLPISIPTHRYPPMTDRTANMCKTVHVDLAGERSTKRHQDQMMLQTSGEYGRFMHPQYDKSHSRLPSARISSRPQTTDGTSSSGRSGGSDRSSRRNIIEVETTQTATTLLNNGNSLKSDFETICKYRKKDPIQGAFMKYTKYDALAAKAPPRDRGEVHWCSVGNQLAAEQSRNWTNGLRPYKRPATSSSLNSAPTSGLAGLNVGR